MHPIVLVGATTHNLKAVSLTLHPGELVALTGPSGAGKSSLALDTLYAEGQRRFVESFSPYARQFLERLERPPMKSLQPAAATVAVDRKAPIKSSRSTLATMTELEPFLAALFACESIPRCPGCDTDATTTTPQKAAADIALAVGTEKRIFISYELRVRDADHFLERREQLVHDGYRRILVGGNVVDLDAVRPSEVIGTHGATDVIIDRVTVKGDSRRLTEALENAWLRGEGRASVIEVETQRRTVITRGLSCTGCGRGFDPPRPGFFSYNSPLGACASCRGFGRTIEVDWDKVIPDPNKTLAKGAIRPWNGKSSEWERAQLVRFAKARGIPLDVAWDHLSSSHREAVLAGEGVLEKNKYPGVRRWFAWLESRTYKMHVRVLLARYRDYVRCTACNGSRLEARSLGYRVAGLNLGEWHALTVSIALETLNHVAPRDPQGARVIDQMRSRLQYLTAAGLGYLSLDRQARTLSGGEAQRAGLTTALGAALTGTMFVLDEPTVGLHASDIPPLLRVFRELAAAGNSVLVIEHEPRVIRACDRVIELGPAAGPAGGKILFDGSPEELAKNPELPTARAWNAEITRENGPRRKSSTTLTIERITEHNLKSITAKIPLGVVCAITGPSGSGKSTLVRDVLYRGVARALGDFAVPRAGAFCHIDGYKSLKRVTLVDQAPLGRTARGNAATYTKAWDRVRARFANEPVAVRKGLTPAHFSFNVDKGRCDACAGEGFETIEMQFLADVMLLCPVCQGKRFRPEVLGVTHRGHGVAGVLAMSIAQALEAFSPQTERDYVLERALGPALDVGLGYLALGQPLSTLSGGEAQRLKLARALSEEKKDTLFILDEPSAGLHALDAAHVVRAMHTLTTLGASVVVVEHDLRIIRSADWVIDLGPGGGPAGGCIVAEGTPEHLATCNSKTGIALATADSGLNSNGKSRAFDVGPSAIEVHGAKEHNLRNLSCRIPHGTLAVVTGPSGSGKSSLAFDVIYAEGQRRFVETLSPYARQFLPMLPRPDVEEVSGVPPTVALEQRTSRAGMNSTVATVTEVAHYLRLLYAKVGVIHCPTCDVPVRNESPSSLFERLRSMRSSRSSTLYAPVVRARKGTHLDIFTNGTRAGIRTARVDGILMPIDPPPKLARSREHSIDFVVHQGPFPTLARDIFDRALSWGNGSLVTGDHEVLSTARACSTCGAGFPELDPRWFSFNTKQGQCESCEGTGVQGGPKTLASAEKPRTCRACKGTRLAPIPRAVQLLKRTYPEYVHFDVTHALEAAKSWRFGSNEAPIAQAPLVELIRRLEFVERVGLGYLGLDRSASSLSGGEMQRLRLSAQLGAGLTGALYVLDEPTIGLHAADTDRLLQNLRALVDTGSTVLVVEHDAEMIRNADYIVDLGPGGGRNGGCLVAEGATADVLSNPHSPTARALAETSVIARPARQKPEEFIELFGAKGNNLKQIDFRVPVGRLTVVAGVSGSGKSTLVGRTFLPAVRNYLKLVTDPPAPHLELRHPKQIKRALFVDQSPIGRTPRSIPATFLGIFDDIRALFARLPEAQARGFSGARFSFNTPKGGRCLTCEGQGARISEMAFLPDVITPCEDCNGDRFEPSTLEVKYKGKSIGEVLRMSASEAWAFFGAMPKIAAPLRILDELGVGYVALGQGSHTLSGGEAQRLKLAAELTAGVKHEPTLYVMDEPTTGLHIADVRRLAGVLEQLVLRGDTLVVIEHHPDVIACADWIVELGPEGGERGGYVVFAGEPEKLRRASTATGRVLKRLARGGVDRGETPSVSLSLS